MTVLLQFRLHGLEHPFGRSREFFDKGSCPSRTLLEESLILGETVHQLSKARIIRDLEATLGRYQSLRLLEMLVQHI